MAVWHISLRVDGCTRSSARHVSNAIMHDVIHNITGFRMGGGMADLEQPP